MVAFLSSSTCNSAFWSLAGHLLSSSKKRIPLFALNILPCVNASGEDGPNFSALTGSMSPSRSSEVRSGLPCTRTNLLLPPAFLVFTSLPVLHPAHTVLSGVQLKPQSFTLISGRSFATFFASVVLPIPGGPAIITCLSIKSADFNWNFASSWAQHVLKAFFLQEVALQLVFHKPEQTSPDIKN